MIGLFLLLLGVCFADTPLDGLPGATRARFEAAEAAWQEGDLDAASAAFVEVTEAAPEFDRGWRRLCGITLARKDVATAVEHCRKAVTLSPSHENRTALAIALLQTDVTERIEEAALLVADVLAEQPDYLPAWVATCQWAADRNKRKALIQCAAKLDALAPNTAGTLLYKALAQAAEGDLQGANLSLFQAQELGLSDELRVQAEARIALQAQRLAAAAQRARQRAKPKKPQGWTVADVLPFFVVGALILAVGVLAFGEDDDEDEADGSSAPPPTP